MKKIAIFLLAAAMMLSVMAGCSSSSSGDKNPVEGAQDAVEDVQEAVSVKLDDVVQSVKDAYGEDYIPSMEIPKEQLSDIYGLNLDDVEEVYAEGPMISAHVDTFIAVKAKEGKGEEVEKQLKEYHDYVLENSLQYPSNEAKVQASQVVRYGDYVFYVILGAFDENSTSEGEQAQFAKEQTQKGLDAIESFFKK